MRAWFNNDRLQVFANVARLANSGNSGHQVLNLTMCVCLDVKALLNRYQVSVSGALGKNHE
jgi:hypothetical protein